MTMHDEKRLDELELGLGSTYGYSGDDLTNVRLALARGEVPYQPPGPEPTRTLELRIHGVGGAPPAVNLEAPATLQVGGDGRAGFHRAWYPGGTAEGRPLQEAYCWGHLDTAWWTAFWLLLLPFGLLNLSHWALPAVGSQPVKYAARALLRLQSLVLTVTLVATTCYVALDLIAWQGAQRGQLPGWLNWFQARDIGTRLSLASVLVYAMVIMLWWLSRRTQGDYEDRESGTRAPDEPGWTLSDRTLWCGARPVARQRRVHLIGCAAMIMLIQGLPRTQSADGLRVAVLVVGIALLAVAGILTVLPWTDRPPRSEDTEADDQRRTAVDVVVIRTAWGTMGLSAVVSLSRFWWPPVDDNITSLPYDGRVQLVLFFTALGLAVLTALLVAAHRPWRQVDVFAGGFASAALVLLATLISTIFTGSLLNSISQLIWKPTLSTQAVHTQVGGGLYLPSTAYSGGLAFLVALGSALAVVVVLLLWVRPRRAKRALTGDDPHDLPRLYAGRGPTQDGLAVTRSQAAEAVSKTVATSKLTDVSAVSLLAVALPTLVVLLGYQILLEMHGVHWAQNLHGWASAGGYAGTVATGAFLAYLRSAVTDPSARKRISFLWDVITFWPRACHPLGPPSYAERSVPEVVTRIRRIVGDIAVPGDPALAQQQAGRYDADGAPAYRERHSDVLLVGYSQGCPIATAVMAQLPEPVRRRTRLLTLASPVRRLYGRTFPAYFGTGQLATLEERLTQDGCLRWTNLVRETDYIGGWVRGREAGRVDHWILDPPVLWEDADPAPPLTHLHSNWFSDPQTRPFADKLL